MPAGTSNTGPTPMLTGARLPHGCIVTATTTRRPIRSLRCGGAPITAPTASWPETYGRADAHGVRPARHGDVGQPERPRPGHAAAPSPHTAGGSRRPCGTRREQVVLGGVVDAKRRGVGDPAREVHLQAVEQVGRRLGDVLDREDVARLTVAAHHPCLHVEPRISARCRAGVRSPRNARGRGSCGARRSCRPRSRRPGSQTAPTRPASPCDSCRSPRFRSPRRG